jgi:hypothetical protein
VGLEEQLRVSKIGNFLPSLHLNAMSVRLVDNSSLKGGKGAYRNIIGQAKQLALVFSCLSSSSGLFLVGVRFGVD